MREFLNRLDHRMRHLLKPELRYAHRHLLGLVGLVVLLWVATIGVAWLAGERQGESRFTPAYWAARVSYGAPVPLGPALPTAFAFARPAASWGIIPNLGRFPGPHNQGLVGECACMSWDKMYSYLFNVANKASRFFSCRYWYPFAAGPRDLGSSIDQYPSIVQVQGAVFSATFDYPAVPQAYDPTIPTRVALQARAHRYGALDQMLQPSVGGGTQTTDAIQFGIASEHRPVSVSFPCLVGQSANGCLDANTDGGVIDVPAPNSTYTSPGGHSVVGIAYNRNKCFTTSAGHTCGATLVSNHWGCNYGVGLAQKSTDGCRAGYVWITDRFCRTYCFGISTIQPGASKPSVTPPPPWAQAGPVFASRHLFPPPTGATGLPMTSHGFYLKRGQIWAKDLPHYDLGGVIQAAAIRYHVEPVMVLATVGAECGFFTHGPTCDRRYPPCDVSFGPMQVTTCTAQGLGLGDGSFSAANQALVSGYEDDPVRGIFLGTRLLGQYSAYEASPVGGNCPVASRGPYLYVPWNTGPANQCWWLMQPTGLAGANFYTTFMGWWRYALSMTTATNQYAPVPRFNWSLWNRHRLAAHQAVVSPFDHGHHLAWGPSVWQFHQRACGSIVAGDQWHPKGRYTTWTFEHGTILTWPRYHRAKVACRG